MKKALRGPLVYVAIILAIVLLTSSFGALGNTDKRELGYTDFMTQVKEGKFSKITVVGYNAYGMLKEGSSVQNAAEFPESHDYRTYIPSLLQFDNDLKSILGAQDATEFGIAVTYEPTPEPSFFVQLLPYLIPIALLAVLWYFMMRQSQGGGKTMSFAKSRAKMTMGEQTGKTFADVAGADEEKEELSEIVDFLRNPRRFTQFGARIPKGVLLVGPPGGGKTLLAKAVAGEAKVPFFSISGSDFVEMFVGVGAARVRDLFESAKKNAPSIIFIDEIDAVGRQRGAGLGGGHDEREQTLNQLLVEMDGFMVNEGIIVMAATNRVDILDPALLRAGRFDRQVYVSYPDVKGREAILRVHSKGKPLGPDVDLSVLAKMTVGFIGADLENIMNEAAILTARRGKKQIGMSEIEEAVTKVMMGPEKKSRVMSERDKEITAYHEVGHAICAKVLPHCDDVHEVSIIPRGMAAGYTMTLPEKDENHYFRSKMLDEIAMMLGGRSAEKLVLGDITTGASNDIERATKMARGMVVKYGMSDQIGPIFHGGDQEVFLGKELGHSRDYSEEVASEIDGEIRRIISECYEKSQEILREHMDQLHHISKVLMEREKITGEEFEILFAGGELPEKPQQSELPPQDSPQEPMAGSGEPSESLEGGEGNEPPRQPQEQEVETTQPHHIPQQPAGGQAEPTGQGEMKDKS
ncbi:ATP-dependent zinc metalloprotease FtsH [Guopingia tenuis]|uniref:ATP-dependent zinc metalloprotease FtsH n=1 Tax=Guopingia tenuis TaxID=2763656 RepID=UPI00201618A4|nr:ATP-dependent zinc metalloprotease FtsH [Guopingia tenuis]